MQYVLQVVRGRSASTILKLANGVTSIGRRDDCLIRIKSSQVSRRHCEVFEFSNKLTIRDLGSSNGTFVNGKKVIGQQVLQVGDEVTLGAVTLRVARIGQLPGPAGEEPASPASKPKPADTAVTAAMAAEAEPELEEFEMEFDEGDAEPEVEGIPLVDEKSGKPPHPKHAPTPTSEAESPAADHADISANPDEPKEDDAVAQFLLDLKLDDDH